MGQAIVLLQARHREFFQAGAPGRVLTGVDHQPVEPGGEPGIALEVRDGGDRF